MKALTAAEMREVDRLTTERAVISSLQLMENAGKSVAEVILESSAFLAGRAPNITVLCGKGNNGGDGFVVARYLKEQACGVEAFLFGAPEELRGDAAANFQRWQDEGNKCTPIRSLQDWESARPKLAAADVIVDALLGTGLRGAAEGVIGQAIQDVNQISRNATAPIPSLIVAVDTPSGLPS